ncbi:MULTISPECIES: hypothetical protein [unclassified Amycolatopsis]|uniref:hypothetical protein n=1 Tax=unclassified Amycolatopsis TaxID=2618356 RepID=UPI001EE812F6|nr:hypothetical protein [Amycolatopsis sp. Poz14]MCG3755349.1 hypothetical protein [Amycolatopsis sp. Poz14]
MDYRKLFGEIRRYPGLYGLDGSYHDYCTFLLGVDTGNGGQLLTGFPDRTRAGATKPPVRAGTPRTTCSSRCWTSSSRSRLSPAGRRPSSTST